MPEISPNDSDAYAEQHLAKTLPTIRESLFHMTDRILDDAAERDWNLLVGDDTAGRLPTYFVRKALQRARGSATPTFFVNASTSMRSQLDRHDYAAYVTANLDPYEVYRPLILTESVGRGTALGTIRQALEDGAMMESIDAAAVVSRREKPDYLRYVGGEGKSAILDVFFCLEAIADTSLKARTLSKLRSAVPQSIKDAIPSRLHAVGRPSLSANVITGLYPPDNAVLPVSEADRVHRLGAAYQALKPLLDEYAESRGLPEVSTTQPTSVIIKEYETL